MQIDLTKEEIQTLDNALEALNRTGVSRQSSQIIMSLSVKLAKSIQEEVKKDGDTE